ncbi:MAG: hypothetical protein FWE42_07470 [Defluviitaleaceae bacterium]|nr:hypothetical protein [Defluviitaleaceae bacterium]
MFILIVWYIITAVQAFLGYGTAYRLTRDGGDNGIALWGWLLLTSIAALIPGLGFYMWVKNQDGYEGSSNSSSNYQWSGKKPSWMSSNKGSINSGKGEKTPWKNPYKDIE